MWAIAPREKPRYLCALVCIMVLVSAGLVFLPRSTDTAAAVTPVFTRPNVRVDTGAGWVGTSSPGGPVIASGVGGVLHAAWSDNRTGDRRIYHARSVNGGQTWIGEALIDGSVGMDNWAPTIAVDTTGGTYNGNVYVAWQRNTGSLADIYFTWSADGGSTWNLRKRIDNAPANFGSFNPRLAVDSDGIVYVAFYDFRNIFPNMDVYVGRSEDGGATWFPEVQVSPGPGTDAYPSITAYNSVVYVAWQEPNNPGTNLWLGYSTNKGNNWAVNNIISLPLGGGDARAVSVTVDPTNIVHAAWIMTDVTGGQYIAYSQTGNKGLAWRPMVQVDDVPASATYIVNAATIIQSSGILYVVWADNRNGNYDIFASWSEDGGIAWGDGRINNNDIRVDDTNDNPSTLDDFSDQASPSAAPGPLGVYAIWSDKRDLVAYHAYFAGFTVSEVMLTEIRDAPQGQEQVEIFNHGGINIDLTGWTLVLGGLPVTLTPLGLFTPGAYLTVGDPVTSNLVSNITLGDEGGIVELRDQLGIPRETIRYGQLGPVPDPLDGESVARVPSGGGYSGFWTRAATPSFGAVNRVPVPRASPPVVLNEVLFNTANLNDRFIELYFKDRGSINLAGFLLVGDAAYMLPPVILTEANPYYIARPSQAPALFALMGPAGDNLYLYDQLGSFLDMAGWTTAHTQGFSMVRIPDGFGTADGFDDVSSAAAGWRFDQVPSLPLVLIGPKQAKYGDLGSRIFYVLTVTNKEPWGAYVNIVPLLGAQAWALSLFLADGVTPLVDSPGDPDTIPDVGLLQPESSIYIQVAVDIPPLPQAQDFEFSSVTATVASDPIASANAALTTGITPYEMPELTANPTTIWRSTLPPSYSPQESTMTVSVTGRGTSLLRQKPQDVVMMIDATGSMVQNDPTGLRLVAAQHYVDLLSPPDRGAVVSFNTIATLVGGHHLSSNYTQIKSDIATITDLGGTDLVRPIQVATNEILGYGDPSHVWVEILLTDGDDTNGNFPDAILAEAQRAANNGIVIFTIGLIGSGGFDEQLLIDIATTTGGAYLRAQTASDLDAVYQMIGRFVKNLAGYDDNTMDDIPMVSVFLPQNISYVPGSANPPADYVGVSPSMTNLQWNVSKITINETWMATFRITSDKAGAGQNASMYPESRVTYIRYDDTRVSLPFPLPLIDVVEPPPPRANYTITRYPEIGTVNVDNVDYPVPAKFYWNIGSAHTIIAPAIDNVAMGERWVFTSWDDNGAVGHSITVLNANTIITAFYYHQFKPTITLQGLDGTHNVSAYFTSMGQSTSQAGNSNSWSDWLDEGSPLSFDTLSTGSNSTERWTTQERFSSVPWTAVSSPFNGLVVYWHQVYPTVLFEGLSDLHPVKVRYTQFATSHDTYDSTKWEGWIDYRSSLSVDGYVLIPLPPAEPKERYMNTVAMGADKVTWTVLAANTYVVHYVHQFRPIVRLVGTDHEHNVSLVYTDTMKTKPTDVIYGLEGNWSDWTDAGTNLTFSEYTTGDPPYKARNATVIFVNSVFTANIVYEPPQPPIVEPNLKPVISAIFVIVLLALGIYWGNRKPWDRYVPPPRKDLKPEELAARNQELKKKTITEKIGMFNLQELQEKFTRDRRWTMYMLSFPFAVVEGMIGVASFATGVFRVPETGNWLSIGLLANTLLLVSGMVFDILMQRRGYRVPGEVELASLREEDLPKAGAFDELTAGKPAAAIYTSEQIIGTLPIMELWFAGFVLPRFYDLVFTDRRLIAIKAAGAGQGSPSAAVETAIKMPQYRSKDLASLVNAKRANFDIPHSSIEKVGMTGLLTKSLIIKTLDKKLRVKVPKEKLNSCQTVLRLSIPQYGMGLP